MPSAACEIVIVMENVGIERITLMIVSQALWPRAQILYLPLPTDQLRTVNLQKCRKALVPRYMHNLKNVKHAVLCHIKTQVYFILFIRCSN